MRLGGSPMSDRRKKKAHQFRALPAAELGQVKGGILHAAHALMEGGAGLFDMFGAAPHSAHEGRTAAAGAQAAGGSLAVLQGLSSVMMGHGGFLGGAAGT